MYKGFQQNADTQALLKGVDHLREGFGGADRTRGTGSPAAFASLAREDLRLICFDVVSSG